MPTKYDLAIIGSGGGAFAAAIRASTLGKSVVMIERGTLGGTCVNTGCVPSKALIAAAGARHVAVDAATRFPGIATTADPVDMPALIAGKQALVESLRGEKYADVADSYGWQVLRGDASFVGTPDAPVLDVAGADGSVETIEAAHFLVATGSRPWAPPIDGLKETGYLTSTTAMELTEVPESLLVLGGGYVALEQAQLFARLGSQVTLLVRSRLASKEEPEVSKALQEVFADGGIRVVSRAVPTRVSRGTGGEAVVTAALSGGSQEFRADQVLVPRTPSRHRWPEPRCGRGEYRRLRRGGRLRPAAVLEPAGLGRGRRDRAPRVRLRRRPPRHPRRRERVRRRRPVRRLRPPAAGDVHRARDRRGRDDREGRPRRGDPLRLPRPAPAPRAPRLGQPRHPRVHQDRRERRDERDPRPDRRRQGRRGARRRRRPRARQDRRRGRQRLGPLPDHGRGHPDRREGLHHRPVAAVVLRMNGNAGNRGDLILKQTMSADQDRDEWRAGPVVAAVTGLLLLACCALPSLLCCGLPFIAAGGALAGVGGLLGNPWIIGAGTAVVMAVMAGMLVRLRRRHRRRRSGCCENPSTADRNR